MAGNNAQSKELSKVGLEAATFLANNFKEALIYEKLTEFIYHEMNNIIDLDQLCFYVLDDEMENLKEEAVYNSTGLLPSYDFISAEQISSTLTRQKVLKTRDKDYNYIKVPLRTGSQILGLIEFRTIYFLNDSITTEIEEMCKTISLGLRSVLFETDTIREKENTEFSIKINNKLQSIDNLDVLITTFLEMTENYYRFDRVTVFIFNKEREIILARGINEMGKEYNVNDFSEIPDIPELSTDSIIIDDTFAYWFPLKTNTGIVGVVLFDNLFTLYKIPDSLLNTLSILSSQFANAIDNIRMFANLQRSAYYDSLTSLRNRNYFEKILSDYHKHESIPLSIIIGDLNGLKITNDVFGHSTGDSLLVKTAEILRKCSPKDALIFRWGGDEFFVLLPGKKEVDANKICKKIKEECPKAEDTKVELSISLGYATRKSKQGELTKIMKEAEDRMYRHKLLETKSYRSSLISSLKKTLAEKSSESAGHAERMTKHAIRVGKKIGLIGSELEDLRLLAMLHDLGKVAIDDEILKKTGPLNDKEWEEIKKHPEAGYRIAQASLELSQISNYILSHHEWWDGNGYPLGKKELEIPLLSRIISVVDVYDVMTHKATYKGAITHQEAIKELDRCAGTQFDPKIVEIFRKTEFFK